jgi:hypothetical protein
MTPISRKTKAVSLLLAMTTIALLIGCSARVGDLTIVSTRNINLSEKIQLNANKATRFSGEDCSFFLLNYYPFFNKIPNLEVAVERALRQGNGNLMLDEVTVASDVWVIIGNIKCIQATGAVLNVPPKVIP